MPLKVKLHEPDRAMVIVVLQRRTSLRRLFGQPVFTKWSDFHTQCQRIHRTVVLSNATLVSATVSFSDSSILAAASAIDGDFNTRWSSNRGSPGNLGLDDWIAVEMAAVERVHSIQIWWESAWALTFGIYVKSTAIAPYTFVSNYTFSSTTSITNNRHLQTVLLNCTEVHAKFVKIVSWTERLIYGTSIWEINVIRDTSLSLAPAMPAPTLQPTAIPSNSPTDAPTAPIPVWQRPCLTRPWVRNATAEATFDPDNDDAFVVQLEDEFENSIALTPSYSFFWTTNGSTVHMALRCALVACPGWMAVGISGTSGMIGSYAIIGQCAVPVFGVPNTAVDGPDNTLLLNESTGGAADDDPLAAIRAQSAGTISSIADHNIREYFLGGKAVGLVTLLPNSSQVVFNTSCAITSTDRILKFSRPLVSTNYSIEPFSNESSSSRQRVIYAFGRSNTLAFHLSMGMRTWEGVASTASIPPSSLAPTAVTASPTGAPSASPSTGLSADQTTSTSMTTPLPPTVSLAAPTPAAPTPAQVSNAATSSDDGTPTSLIVIVSAVLSILLVGVIVGGVVVKRQSRHVAKAHVSPPPKVQVSTFINPTFATTQQL
jgi:hypothetical protein